MEAVGRNNRTVLRLFAPCDLETGDRFLTAPVSGNTYRLRGGDKLDITTRAALWLDGVRRWRDVTLDPLEGASEHPPAAPLSRALSDRHSPILDEIWSCAALAEGRVPLHRLASRMGVSRSPSGDVSRREALHFAHALRIKTSRNCLPHSFWQAGLLRHFGVPSVLYVGVWMPTTEAHAWVMAASPDDPRELCVLGDSIDRVALYAPTMRFEFGDPFESPCEG